MEIIKEGPIAISKAIKILNQGGIVVFPCETVYGVAVDSHNEKAVSKLSKYKQRPLGKPYAIMCDSKEMAEQYVFINNVASNLYKKFLPGPITVVSKAKGQVARGVESENKTLGVRIPDYEFILKLINKFGRPIVATSANASYKKRPYKITDIFENLSKSQKDLVDLVIDAGELPHNEPSTVVDTTIDDEPIILRQGDLKLKNKNEILSRNEENTQNLGKELWQKYENISGQRALIFALQGEMGSGKTQLTKGIAKAMGIKDNVTSPTFAIENDYETKTKKLFHFDTWRLADAGELKALDFENLINKNSVVVIEWAEKVTEIIKKYQEDAMVVWIKIAYGKTETERLISWGVAE